MPVRHDPILAEAIAALVRARWRGRRVLGLTLDPDGRRAALRLERGPAIVFLLHPEHGHVLARERVFPGEELEFRNLRLTDAATPPDERLLSLDLGTEPERPRFRIVAELHTNQWNLLLLRLPGAEIERVLWPRRPGDRVLEAGAEYEPLASDREGRREPVTAERWRRMLEPLEPGERRAGALRSVAYLSALNVEWVLGSATGRVSAASAEPDPLDAAYRRYRELCALRRNDDASRGGGSARLLERRWGLQPYPHPLGDPDPPRADDLLDAMAAAARGDGTLAELDADESTGREATREPPDPELVELAAALDDRLEELEARRGSLRRELEEGAEPDALRSVGSLLLARKSEVPRGEESVRLEDFTGGQREIELDPRLSATENAERYFEQARRRERATERIPEEIASVEERMERVRSARRELERALESPDADVPEERVETWWGRAGGRRDGEEAEGEEQRRPYRVLRTSGGLEVRVGKSARSNEELTFHHSHTEDVWLHARQVPGSHVILRWGRKDQNPPRDDLLEAAVAAAVNSKARHSGSVAVDWTRRKYVRSPRKSSPGAVIPQQHETVFVRPDREIVKRMQERARTGGGVGEPGKD